MTTYTQQTGAKKLFALIKQALAGGEQDYTQGSIRRAVVLLAIPMILEMMMESIFAVVDIFFVGRVGNEAVSTVGLTESMLTIIYSIGLGLSMGATAIVARRIGEKNTEAASRSAAQAILLSLMITVVISVTGIIFGADLLKLIGAPEELAQHGKIFTRIIFGGSISIMLLFLINGIFRGAGDASIAMQSLAIANVCNIILCPALINGLGPFPKLGLEGAAIATTTGRSIGVAYQLIRLFGKNTSLRIKLAHFKPDWKLMGAVFSLGWMGAAQYLIGSASWIVLASIMIHFGEGPMAGYMLAIRLVMFFLLPAWGMSNAAATLVGQNLGAKEPQRAEQSVWKVAQYTMTFMLIVSIVFYFFATPLVDFMNNDAVARQYAIQVLRTVSLGYVFYGLGMVMGNALNGAGDTKTPTIINVIGFWLFQIPVALLLTRQWQLGPQGVFIAIVSAEVLITIISTIVFRRGKWKKVKV